MIDVRMGYNNCVELCRPDGERLPVPVLELALLKHPTVDQHFFPLCFQAIFRSGHLPIRAEKMQPGGHGRSAAGEVKMTSGTTDRDVTARCEPLVLARHIA